MLPAHISGISKQAILLFRDSRYKPIRISMGVGLRRSRKATTSVTPTNPGSEKIGFLSLIDQLARGLSIGISPYGCFQKWWYPTTMGFPTKNDHFGVFWGYHHLREHPYRNGRGFFDSLCFCCCLKVALPVELSS